MPCSVISWGGGHKGAGPRGSDWRGSCPLLPLITECTVLLYKTEITLSQLQIILHAATYSLSRLKTLVVRFSLHRRPTYILCRYPHWLTPPPHRPTLIGPTPSAARPYAQNSSVADMGNVLPFNLSKQFKAQESTWSPCR